MAALSTVACAFAVLGAFGRRREAAAARRRLRRQAGRAFVGGVASLLVYLAGHQALADDFYFRVLGWESGDLRRMAGDLLLLVAYAAFFFADDARVRAAGIDRVLRASGPAAWGGAPAGWPLRISRQPPFGYSARTRA